jgi:HemY protein
MPWARSGGGARRAPCGGGGRAAQGRAHPRNCHPDIANAYADLVPGASARDRLTRVRLLARVAESHPEGALALANAALEAHEFAEARATLAPLLATPTRRVATLMARIEATEHGDTGLAREWMARAVHAPHDPVWTADGVIAETWMPVSPVTGRLDAFQWRVPVADLTPRGPTVEQTSQPLRLPLSPEPSPKPAAQLVMETTLSPSVRPADQPDGLPAHAPDDPGPDAEQPFEPVPRPVADTAGKMRSWFSRAALK